MKKTRSQAAVEKAGAAMTKKAAKVAGTVETKASKEWGMAKKKAISVKTKVKQYIKKNPKKAVLIGAAAAAAVAGAIALAMKRKKSK